MPYKITWEDRGSLWTYTGYVSAEELIESNETFLNDERSDYARYQLIDMTQITGVEDSQSCMKMLAASDFGAGHYLRRMRVALTANLPEMRTLMQEYVRILNNLQSNWKAQLFDDIDEARAWAEAFDSDSPWRQKRIK